MHTSFIGKKVYILYFLRKELTHLLIQSKTIFHIIFYKTPHKIRIF